MSSAEQIDHLTLADFMRLYEQDGAFEFIDGERKPVMPPVAIHGLMIRLLFRLLDAWCSEHGSGEVVTEMLYVLLYHSDWVKGARVPDLMFFAAARWQEYVTKTENWKRKPFILVPDLVIEIVSQNDLYTEIQDKVDRYLEDGVRLVWVIDPQRSRVTVFEGNRYTKLGKDEILTGSDVLPGFELNLTRLFDESSL
jgi:Uma2 family endonuclease